MALSEAERLERIENEIKALKESIDKLSENIYSMQLNNIKRIDELEARIRVLEAKSKSSWGRKDVLYLFLVAASWLSVIVTLLLK